MDRGTLAVFIPILVMTIPIVAIIFGGLQRLAKLRLEEARLRANAGSPGELDELRHDVQQLRQELGEVQERLDFTERLLAQKDRSRLGQEKP
jgi:hypothetical protein